MKNSKSIFKIITIVSAFAIISMLVLLLSIDFIVEKEKQNITLATQFAVNADLYVGDGDYAVILAIQNDSEYNRIKSLVRFFYDSNATILTFAYDDINEEDKVISSAIDAVKLQTGLTDERILLLGYGSASANLLDYTIASTQNQMGLLLFAPHSIDKIYQPNMLSVPTLILGTTSDDIATPQTITNLYNNLSGDDIRATGFAFKSNMGNKSLKVSSGVFNSYNAYSRQVLTDLSSWLNDDLGVSSVISLVAPTIRIYSWVIILILFVALLISIYNVLIRTVFHTSYSLISNKDFFPPVLFFMKSLLWLIVIPISGVIIFLLWLTPMKNAVIPYSIGIYLCVNSLAVYYIYKHVKLPMLDKTYRFVIPNINKKRFSFALILMLLIICFTSLLSKTGLFGLAFSPADILCFVILVFLTGIAFFITFYENMILNDMNSHYLIKGFFQVFSYLPLIAIAIISLPLANFTALLSCSVYLFILYISILIHRIIGHLTANPYITAIITAVLFSGFLSFVVI